MFGYQGIIQKKSALSSHSVTPTKVRGMEFWTFGLGQNIFDFRGRDSPMRGGHFLGEGQLILHRFSHFEMQDFKNSKSFACGTIIFIIHISRFKMDAGFQVDIDFNTESKCLCSRSRFFSPLSGHSKATKPMKLLSFLSI